MGFGERPPLHVGGGCTPGPVYDVCSQIGRDARSKKRSTTTLDFSDIFKSTAISVDNVILLNEMENLKF
jgi:hypothetical protein